jgi:hypothetical protein
MRLLIPILNKYKSELLNSKLETNYKFEFFKGCKPSIRTFWKLKIDILDFDIRISDLNQYIVHNKSNI